MIITGVRDRESERVSYISVKVRINFEKNIKGVKTWKCFDTTFYFDSPSPTGTGFIENVAL